MKSPPTPRRPTAPAIAAVAVVVAVLSQFVTVGADSIWLVALGGRIRSQGTIPLGVPFLAADTSTWVNVPVLNEVAFSVIAGLGPGGLLTAQILSAATALLLLSFDARARGAGNARTVAAVGLFALGNLVSLGIVRAQMWSLPLFAALVLLLRADRDRPSRRIWILVPLVALWGNLHGAVLVGVAVAGAHLLLSRLRRRPTETLVVGVSMVAALWATPAGLRSHEYYIAILTSEAVGTGGGMWGPIQLANPTDLLLVVVGLILLIAAVSGRIPLWEWVAGAGLLALTIHAARNGLWLLAFLTPRAAVASLPPQRARGVGQSPERRAKMLAVVVVTLSVGLVITGISGRAHTVETSQVEARQIATLVGPQRPTLAPSPLSEWLATSGARLWAGNPLEALSRDRQRAYLDFVTLGEASVPSLSPPPDAIVLPRVTHERKLAPYMLVGETTRYSVYVSAKPS